MRDRIRLGIIGTSGWTELMYLKNLHNRADVEIAGLCGRSSERLAEMAARYGATATYTFNGRSVALIGDYGPDRSALDVSWGSSHQAVDTQVFFSPRAVIFGHRFNSAGSHTVTVTVTSTTRVDLDALIFQN